MSLRSIFIDCDPGWDDAAALCLALHYRSEFNVVAVSTVFGNADVSEVTDNACKLLNYLAIENIPIFKGSNKSSWEHAVSYSNTANITLKNVEFMKSNHNNYQFIADNIQDITSIINASKSSITGVCLGPLTNIALLLRDGKLDVSQLIILGGALSKDACLNWPEFNFAMDSKAASEVMLSSCEKTLIPIDVCNQIPAELFSNVFSKENSRSISAWNKIIESYICRIENNVSKKPLYDPVAILFLIFPQAFTTERTQASIKISSDTTNGELFIDKDKGGNVNIVRSVNLELLLSLFKRFVDL